MTAAWEVGGRRRGRRGVGLDKRGSGREGRKAVFESSIFVVQLGRLGGKVRGGERSWDMSVSTVRRYDTVAEDGPGFDHKLWDEWENGTKRDRARFIFTN